MTMKIALTTWSDVEPEPELEDADDPTAFDEIGEDQNNEQVTMPASWGDREYVPGTTSSKQEHATREPRTRSERRGMCTRALSSFKAIVKKEVPTSYKEAMASPEHDLWQAAIGKEISALQDNGT
jgi:hypothetical protein